ncbi:MAG: heme o synthase [Planctomycetota bacterium]
MNVTSIRISASSRNQSLVERLQDYLELTKPRISTLVLVTVAVGGFVATWGQPDPYLLFHAIVGTGLVAASSCIWNQWIERDTDARMPRTANRPIASGRVGRTEVYILGSALLLIGVVELAFAVNVATAVLGLVTWLLYVAVYTPLKTVTRWNTLVGAVPGALPVMIGWSAMGQPFDVRAAAMFLIVFLWQFPHFMAIAWKYRHEYGSVGIQMVTVTDPSGRRAGVQAVVGAIALIPASLVPAIVAPPSRLYAAFAIVLGLIYLLAAVRFWQQRDDGRARTLLRTSLIYLPLVMFGLACLPLA